MAYPRLSGEDQGAAFTVELTEKGPMDDQPSPGIGFEGLDDKDTAPKNGEDTQLLKEGTTSPRPRLNTAERKVEENSVFFADGVRRIDYILTFTLADKERDEKHADDRDKRKRKREKFLTSFKTYGLEYEIQGCDESPDRETHFVKIHATFEALLDGAESMNIRLPFSESTLRENSWRERLFDYIKVRDPLLPNIERKHEIKRYLTAPFRKSNQEDYININDPEIFFSTAQRSAITYDILQRIQYGPGDDQIGIARMLGNHSFSRGFPLHDGPYSCGSAEEIESDRQFLYYHWSKWTNFYKSQPLDHVRTEFGEKIGIYFTWAGFYTE